MRPAAVLLLLSLVLLGSHIAQAAPRPVLMPNHAATDMAAPTDLRKLLGQAAATSNAAAQASTQSCDQYDGGRVSGGGVTDCYYTRALKEATNACNGIANDLRNEGKAVRPCTTCSGKPGRSVWIVGVVDTDTRGGTWGSARKCSFVAEYGCCLQVVDPFASGSQAGGGSTSGGNTGTRTPDRMSLLNDPCACDPMTENPRTHQKISCSCYFKDQVAGKACPNAKWGEGSQMWFKYC